MRRSKRRPCRSKVYAKTVPARCRRTAWYTSAARATGTPSTATTVAWKTSGNGDTGQPDRPTEATTRFRRRKKPGKGRPTQPTPARVDTTARPTTESSSSAPASRARRMCGALTASGRGLVRCCCARAVDRLEHGERGARAGRALDGDLAAHHAREAPRQREAEPDALGLAVVRPELVEDLEDRLVLLGRDPGTRVEHADGRAAVGERGGAQLDVTLAGELGGVGEEVVDDDA